MPEEDTGPRSRWANWAWGVSIFAGVFAFGCGLYEFLRSCPSHNCSDTSYLHWLLECLPYALYSSGALLFLNFNLPKETDSLMRMAALAAPVAVGVTAFALVLEFAGSALRRAGVWMVGGHTVVSALSLVGGELAREFREKGRRRVLVIRPGMSDSEAQKARRAGCVMLGDGDIEEGALSRSRLYSAQNLFAVDDADTANIGVAAEALRLVDKEGRGWIRREPLQIFVQIVDPALRALFARQPAVAAGSQRAKMCVFNMFERIARLTLRDLPLDYERLQPDDGRRVHLILVGLGWLGEALLLQAARVGHYANRRPLCVTVFDRDPAVGKALRWRYTEIEQVCDVWFHPTTDGEDPKTLETIKNLCSEENAIPTVMITFMDETRGLALALSLIRRFEVAVPIRVRSDSGRLLSAKFPDLLAPNLAVFGSLRDACESECMESHL